MGRLRANAFGGAAAVAWVAAGGVLVAVGVVAVAGLLLVEAGCELFERGYEAEHGQRPGLITTPRGPRR